MSDKYRSVTVVGTTVELRVCTDATTNDNKQQTYNYNTSTSEQHDDTSSSEVAMMIVAFCEARQHPVSVQVEGT